MKKLMFAATVAAAMAGFAVESQVVGYQQIAGEGNGFCIVTPTFAGVSAPYSIQDIKLVGNGATGGGMQLLQIIDSEGCVQEEDNYGWYLEGEVEEKEGWYNNFSYAYANITLDPGLGLLMNNYAGDYEIQFAGQVNYTAVPAFECEGNGFCAVGNMTPVAKNVQLFTLAGEGATGGGMQLLQIIEEEGCVQEKDNYGWYLEGEVEEKEGWYNNFSYAYGNVDILPGQGLLMNNYAGDYTINIPGTGDELPEE